MLLHVCCATCAAYPVGLLGEVFDITMFFYNPNIHPGGEYRRRLKDVERLSKISNIPLITGTYEPERWFMLTEGLEDEPEGGKRCAICFHLRLEETARLAAKKGMDIFAATLSISPHKNAGTINEAGLSISRKYGIDYYLSDLKKKNGFKKTNELSRSYGFYRQDYCGCIYSMKT